MGDQGGGSLNEALRETSFLQGANALYVETLYEKWLGDPKSVGPTWAQFFASMDEKPNGAVKVGQPGWARKGWPLAVIDERIAALDGDWSLLEPKIAKKAAEKAAKASAEEAPAPIAVTASVDVQRATMDSIKALMMIRAFRMRGHLAATLDPLGLSTHGPQSELDPASYGFGPGDLDRPIFIDHVLGLEYASVRQMLEILTRTYCGPVGIEFMHMSDPQEKSWLQERIEGPDKAVSFTVEGKRAILRKLIETESFERFVHRKFPGTKRFGIDGGEAMVPALEQIIKRGGNLGVEEIIVGMPHRGRLNVLAAVMGKPYRAIFHEFQGGASTPESVLGSGDVKYHLGASSDRSFDGNRVHLSLTANPSHLEAVDPVVLGKARAKQEKIAISKAEATREAARPKVLPLLLHGDAAFAGQGMVAECFALSGLKGYRTGGTIHFIVNNQIGFTTAPRFSRSSPHPSDVALMVQAPIFHVNGDDPEAVVYAAKVATEFRQKFQKDVVIDMVCYRRFGHNEGDDPTFTQPLMYERIRDHASVREIYAKRLVAEGVATAGEVDGWVKEFDEFLDAEFEAGKSYKPNRADWLDGVWTGFSPPDQNDEDWRGNTGVDLDKLRQLGLLLNTPPTGIAVHKTVERVIGARRAAVEAGEGLDWATAEQLAFATLVDEGYAVRLSGQDSIRGTFSQRHSAIIDQKTEERYFPLNHIRAGQAQYEVIDSLLSEEAVLGFEYGYTLADPRSLVLWEAQFGDFANGAQVIVDQFISSGERKWLRMSGLVMLLPHGYEGQGPEHSSARLERYLQLCAEDNMQVANCTTPANYFHILRRQMHRKFRKPLVLMTPKSLLRHKRCVSRLSEMAKGASFHRVLWDDAQSSPGATSIVLKADAEIKRVLLCSGKVYYDLLDEREKRGRDDVYLLRLEQLFPFPARSLMKELERFPTADMVWVQEEPRNMGGWSFADPWLEWTLDKTSCAAKRFRYVGRPASASTAVGTLAKHNKELETFMGEAFA